MASCHYVDPQDPHPHILGPIDFFGSPVGTYKNLEAPFIISGPQISDLTCMNEYGVYCTLITHSQKNEKRKEKNISHDVNTTSIMPSTDVHPPSIMMNDDTGS